MEPTKSIDTSFDNVEADMGPYSMTRKTTTQALRVFHCDPSAEAVSKELDKFSTSYIQSLSDPKHPFHTTIPEKQRVELIKCIVEFNIVRMKADFAKQKYYNPGPADTGLNPLVQINQINSGGFAEDIPTFE